jgi:hypothetical protein
MSAAMAMTVSGWPSGCGFGVDTDLLYLRNPAGLASALLSIVCVNLIWSIALSVEERSAERSRSTRDPLHPQLRTLRGASTVTVPDRVAARRSRYQLIFGASDGAVLGVLNLPTDRDLDDERALATQVISTYSPV